MDQGIAALIAGLAGAAGGLGGAVVGGLAAVRGARTTADSVRQQVQDQASAEHQHWLRGQRQQAYASYIGVVAAFIAECELTFFCSEADQMGRMVKVQEAREAFFTPLAMVRLVGPDEARSGAQSVLVASTQLLSAMESRTEDTADPDKPVAVVELAREMGKAQGQLLDALRTVLTDPPSGSE
ncbi:hypothetical protein AB0P45_32450 [Streptomyces niveus]|uniref:hypothetical protein n=1 Tax=Streptomyces niveus TaxID=193462 RepID=UPI00343329A4